MPMSATDVVVCDDGYTLQITRFEPAEPIGITVLVCPAIFVRERYYAAFAGWLAERGVRALTFANRGAGRSLAAETGPWDHRIEHWGERDLPAMVARARADRPGDRLFVVGHSMGGQTVGLSGAVHALDGVVSVASTAAWWGHWPRPARYGILAWYCAVPLLGRALPVMPADLAGLGPDLDAEIARGWAKWGRHPDYLFGPFGLEDHLASYRGRVLAWSFTDDRLGCHRAVQALHGRYARAELDERHVDPARVGVPAIGHFGWFRRGIGEVLWADTLSWFVA